MVHNLSVTLSFLSPVVATSNNQLYNNYKSYFFNNKDQSYLE